MKDYAFQLEAEKAIYAYFQSGKRGNPLIAMPTGSGKSHVIANFTRSALRQWPNQRFVIATHVKELVKQNASKLLEAWPEAPVGIHSAGLRKRDTQHPLIFGGIASMKSKVEAIGRRDMLIIDEAHLVSPDNETTYQKFIRDLRTFNPGMPVLGLTATYFRLGLGLLTNGGIFTDIIYDLTNVAGFNRMIQEGYLAPLIPKRTNTQLDVSNVSIRGGEFVQSELQAAVDKDDTTYRCLVELCQAGVDRKSWLIFASGVDHAVKIASMLNSFGVPAAAVHARLSSKERDKVIADFRAGRLRAVVNNNVLTTGFDHPPIDLIGMLRPTSSPSLWVQMAGRGTRTYDGKLNCIAEGQRVLTDQGLVPIEQVTTAMRVWDGVDFVGHCGIVFRGEQEVIAHNGLTATRDHKVWTQEGWTPFGRCADEQIPIAVTADGGDAIKLANGYFRTGYAPRKDDASAPIDGMPRVPQTILQGSVHTQTRYCGVSKMWQETEQGQAVPRCSEMAMAAMQRSETALHESTRPSVQKLRRARHSVPIQNRELNGAVDYGQLRLSAIAADRPNRQRRTLRAGKSSHDNCEREYVQQPHVARDGATPCLPLEASNGALRRQHFDGDVESRPLLHASSGALRAKIVQTKRRVWDILNCGPRHRFTCEGLLVSNCLLLDFAGNTARLGPINDPRIPKKGKSTGDVPVRLCPQCGCYNHAAALACIACGYVFPRDDKLSWVPSEAPLLKDEQPIVQYFDVNRVVYHAHPKPNAPTSLRVTYYSGTQHAFKEWVHVERDGFAGKYARQWWEQRCTVPSPTPGRLPFTTTEQALRMTHLLKQPKRIRVHTNKEPPEILGYEF